MQYDVTALGEILIDFSPAGTDPNGDPLFAQKAGGAPVNLLAAVSRYDGRTAFIGKVGDDLFGKTLRKTLIQCGISDRGSGPTLSAIPPLPSSLWTSTATGNSASAAISVQIWR